jgi:hypothetical protein
VSPVRYEQGCYIPEDDILHSHRRENLKSYDVSCWSAVGTAAEIVTGDQAREVLTRDTPTYSAQGRSWRLWICPWAVPIMCFTTLLIVCEVVSETGRHNSEKHVGTRGSAEPTRNPVTGGGHTKQKPLSAVPHN